MTIPFFIEEPITWKKVEVPYDIIQYCDSFTLDADGHPSMLQLQMMLLNSLKIVHYFHGSELKCDVLPVVRT